MTLPLVADTEAVERVNAGATNSANQTAYRVLLVGVEYGKTAPAA
jgi:hypothetical protein